MRLDHLLSRETLVFSTFLYPFLSEQIWGGSSAGRASALHAEGQGFKSPSLHQIYFLSEQIWDIIQKLIENYIGEIK